MHVDLKEDLLLWLKQNGRLPSTTTQEYFDEIKLLNQLREENIALKRGEKNYKLKRSMQTYDADQSLEKEAMLKGEQASQDKTLT